MKGIYSQIGSIKRQMKDSEKIMNSITETRYAIVAALALVLTGTPPTIRAQAAGAPAAEENVVVSEVNETATVPALDDAAKMEIRRQSDELRNELRRQYLDDRAESITRWAKIINWWLAGVAILFSALGIVLTFSFRQKAREAIKKTQESADKASQAADEANELVKRIEEHEKQAEKGKQSIGGILEEVSSMTDSAGFEQPEESAENIQQSPESSMLKKEITRAVSLQGDGEIEKAIEKWRAIANLAEKIDKKVSARSWRQVGFLMDEPKDKVSAYSEAIHFDPQNALAYNNRGIAKAKLERYHSAIEDYDEAIRLNPKYSTAYKFRGSAKAKLKEYEDSIKDYDKAISIDPKYTWAYINRGQAKLELRGIKESRSDFQTALELANKSDNKKLATRISKIIKLLGDRKTKKQD